MKRKAAKSRGGSKKIKELDITEQFELCSECFELDSGKLFARNDKYSKIKEAILSHISEPTNKFIYISG